MPSARRCLLQVSWHAGLGNRDRRWRSVLSVAISRLLRMTRRRPCNQSPTCHYPHQRAPAHFIRHVGGMRHGEFLGNANDTSRRSEYIWRLRGSRSSCVLSSPISGILHHNMPQRHLNAGQTGFELSRLAFHVQHFPYFTHSPANVR